VALDPRWSAVPLPAKLARWRVARAVARALAARRALEGEMVSAVACGDVMFSRARGRPTMYVDVVGSTIGQLAMRCALLEHEARQVRAEAPTFNSIDLVRWLTAARDEHDRRQAARRAARGYG
jgi:hypothetical protein